MEGLDGTVECIGIIETEGKVEILVTHAVRYELSELQQDGKQ